MRRWGWFTGRVPLSAKLIGNVRALNRLGSMMPGLANWGASLRPVRAILNRVMKMHPRRSLPRFERSLYAWWRDHERTTAFYDPGQIAHVSDTRRGVVVLFADCFTAYNEPHIGIAEVPFMKSTMSLDFTSLSIQPCTSVMMILSAPVTRPATCLCHQNSLRPL